MFDKFLKKNNDYQFSEPESTACMACTHVLDEHLPILYVAHDEEDGMWQFMCGADGHDAAHAKIVSLGQVSVIDPSVNDLYDMPLAMAATRTSVKGRWQPFKL